MAQLGLARLLGVQEVEGSNPSAPTNFLPSNAVPERGLYKCRVLEFGPRGPLGGGILSARCTVGALHFFRLRSFQ